MTGPSPPDRGEDLPGFLARAPATRRLATLARRAAARANTVLIAGETGAGKSQLARALHSLARGAEARFVLLDCSSLPEGLRESELFGHEADAFSGAVARKPGRFELAHGGTLLLDAVENLSLELQAMLLRVLESRSFERVGGQETVEVDVLLVATTSEDLEQLVARGAFRQDLFYRLNVVRLDVPPLRERRQDIGPLAEAFLRDAPGGARLLGDDVRALLERQPWPGNARQLRNVLHRAAALASSESLDVADVEACLEPGSRSPDRALAELASLRLSLQELEKAYIARVMHAVGGRVGKAAEILGIHRKTLLDKRKRYGLD